MNEDTVIKIKAYYKKELANFYNISVRQLVRYIKKCKDLNNELKKLGYTNTDKMFTQKMVEKIFNYLGRP